MIAAATSFFKYWSQQLLLLIEENIQKLYSVSNLLVSVAVFVFIRYPKLWPNNYTQHVVIILWLSNSYDTHHSQNIVWKLFIGYV